MIRGIQILTLLALLIPATSSRAENIQLEDLKLGIGVGIQFGGAVGIQLATESEGFVKRLSVGVYGLTIGRDLFVTDKISVGA